MIVRVAHLIAIATVSLAAAGCVAVPADGPSPYASSPYYSGYSGSYAYSAPYDGPYDGYAATYTPDYSYYPGYGYPYAYDYPYPYGVYGDAYYPWFGGTVVDFGHGYGYGHGYGHGYRGYRGNFGRPSYAGGFRGSGQGFHQGAGSRGGFGRPSGSFSRGGGRHR